MENHQQIPCISSDTVSLCQVTEASSGFSIRVSTRQDRRSQLGGSLQQGFQENEAQGVGLVFGARDGSAAPPQEASLKSLWSHWKRRCKLVHGFVGCFPKKQETSARGKVYHGSQTDGLV